LSTATVPDTKTEVTGDKGASFIVGWSLEWSPKGALWPNHFLEHAAADPGVVTRLLFTARRPTHDMQCNRHHSAGVCLRVYVARCVCLSVCPPTSRYLVRTAESIRLFLVHTWHIGLSQSCIIRRGVRWGCQSKGKSIDKAIQCCV